MSRVMSKIIQVGSEWPAFSGLQKLVIFGDSYSEVGYSGGSTPTFAKPLGTSFPGGGVWNEPGTPNWVGHLITKYAPRPYSPEAGANQEESYKENPLLVYDYAVGGATVSGVRSQIGSRFLPAISKKGSPLYPWSSKNALFITWIGTNDCTFASEHEHSVVQLFSSQKRLYEEAGARNFMFIDVPNVHRAPAFANDTERTRLSTTNWNNALRSSVEKFASSHPDATVLLFSAGRAWDNILDDPSSYGFTDHDIRRSYGKFWTDILHPTTKVHDLAAKDMAKFLESVQESAV